jgi:FMN reductase
VSTRRLAVVSAGLRVPSTTQLLASQLAEAATRELAAAGEGREAYQVLVRQIEVREHAHAIVDALLTGFPTGDLAAAVEDVVAADAVVLVTPVYQASFSGLFKSFVDLIEEGRLSGKPVLLAATGGTERHSLAVEYALRPLAAHLGAVSVPTGVFAATGDLGGPDAPRLAARIERAARELAALVHGGPVVAPARDELADPTPFAELLARGSRE